MKKVLVAFMVMGLLTAALAVVGCSKPAADTQVQTDAAAAQAQDQAQQQAQDQAQQAQPAQQAPAPTQSGQITEDEAKAIAFGHAGVTEADVSHLYVHLETDDGITKYEVDFNVGTTEYDYDIDAASGSILEVGVDVADDDDDWDDYDD